ncbi:GAF and ANTAR domain-containing protein [Streptomyces albidochromogenes]|uniref:GAF and ANTAR domain-containing protein n=1 Tax=Streptomyces albidochromogenes TaxID=329524 RepID=UPI00110F8FC7|nr:GAF and ANTAR domain-containing protein [Streptomyces albidochromogenes]
MTDTARDAEDTGRRPVDGFDLASIQDAVTEWRGLHAFLQDVTERAVRAMEGADACSITMRRDGRLVTAAADSGGALELDLLQYEAEAGPCVCSMENGEENYVPDMLVERRWAPYPAAAAKRGARSVLATPLALNSHSLGALNLYSAKPDAFVNHLETARRLSAQAAGAVAVAERIEQEAEAVNDLRTAMLSRSVIDQAIGIVIARRRCTPDEAMAVLRRASQARNIKLRDLCHELVSDTGGGPPLPGSFVRRGRQEPPPDRTAPV